ncbi:MAG: hypothetical protein M1830_000044 [Pleopsidium flavum]|nr:MAG: hypothetical protein M1830_000044 [Pleopsidium flavum]
MRPWLLAAVGLLLHSSQALLAQGDVLVDRATTNPAPIVVPASQNWDGVDGAWSSFTLRVGTPSQNVRVFISTAGQETWVVIARGCAYGSSTCADARGGLFSPNTSSTWQYTGQYTLYIEDNLDLGGGGVFGNDTVGLGGQGSEASTLDHQIVGGIVTENFYLGMFGVNPKSTNFTNLTEGQPSYLSSLYTQGKIPSLSFGYTAGAQYRKWPFTLTLGGYDLARFTPNNLTFTFAPDNSRDVVVGIQSITSTDSKQTQTSLLPSGILAYVDSTVPYIWLPSEACQAFEKAFGLIYDSASQLYLVDDSLHKSLLALNASVSFTLGNTITGGQTVDIVLPYGSFDLTIKPPLVENSTRYFPLKRAANQTQYTLGRTFLQEAYLIVDWERSNFSISQCLFSESLSQQIVTIRSINATSNSNVPPSNSDSASTQNSSISSGAIAGIVVGTILFVALLVVGLALFLMRKRKKKTYSYTDTAELPVPSSYRPAEHITRFFGRKELGDTGKYSRGHELEGKHITLPELGSASVPEKAYAELDANEPGSRGSQGSQTHIHELVGEDFIAELPSADLTTRSLHEEIRSPALSSPTSSPTSSPCLPSRNSPVSPARTSFVPPSPQEGFIVSPVAQRRPAAKLASLMSAMKYAVDPAQPSRHGERSHSGG